MFAADFGTGQVFVSMLWFFLFFIWIWMLIAVFGDIFRILFALVKTIEMDGLLLIIQRDEIGAHGAGLEGAFLTVNEQGPGIIRIGRCAPGAMLPDGIEAVIFERDRKSVV